MKKKVLSLVLALLMAASSASAVLADEAIADVEETAVVEEVVEAGQYDKAIEFLANYGIFKGISADDLGADLDVERYQMALFVARVSTGWVDDSKWEDGPENWSEFTDISEGPVANYWGALSYVNAKGIIEGYGNGKFGPTDGITYQNALTMTVRTLGYTGLEWPWGYIEKAVSLGLTDGIVDVAYTDELTRGEVAQIIYNALFAKTKAGDTLAMSSFGIEFGWEKVIVTASDLNIFTKDSKDAVAALQDETYVKYDKSNKTDYDLGLVAFQLLNDDGTLADDVYYVKAADLGLVGEHDDELAVGDAYYVLFEQDKNNDLVKVVAYESLYTETLVNAGKTDDEGEAVDYAIEAWLDEHTLVSKYSSNAYVNVTASTKDEVMVFTANNNVLDVVTGTNYAIAIDWATGDILVPADVDGDGKWTDDYDATKEDKNVYTLKYSWNDTLKKYYEVVFDRDVDDFADVAINWISEKEMEKLLEDYQIDTLAPVTGFCNAAESRLAKSAYASLKLFDTNLDGEAERGIYETYRLGYFENKANNYNCGCGSLDSYKISDVGTLAKAIAASKAKIGDDKGDVFEAAWTVREEGIKCKHSTERAWLVDDSELVLAVDEDGEETGYYAPAYVIYNYDKETGAIKVVKNITAGDDEDSFVATGIVRAYNVSKGTVVIGEETYNINAYDELLGNGFKYADDTVATKAVYGALLRSLFNQFVEYVVVDGELVHVAAKDATKSDVIVVDSYAGLSSDGYIVVNGYKASELKYDQFRIGSYNGWQKGDYYYYLDKETAEESFTKGTIYAITSYDKEEDVYFVSLSGSWNRNFDEYTVEDDVNLYATTITSTAADNADGYMTVTIKGKTSDVKMKSTDKYIIIPEAVSGRPFTNVIVYEGKLDPNWTVIGDRINSDDPENRTYIIVNATTVIGFANNDAYKTGLVLFLNGSYTAADYNGQFAEDAYLLGAVEYEATVIDLLTGNLEAVRYATNKNLKDGHVYYTTNDVITEDAGLNGVSGVAQLEDIIDEISVIYGETDIDYAQYLTGRFNIDETNAKKFFGKDENNDDAEKWIGSTAVIRSLQGRVDLADAANGADFEGLADLRGDAKYRKGIIGDIVYRVVNYEDNDDSKEIESIKSIDWDGFKKLVKDYEYYDFGVWFVYDVDGNIVCYISNAPDLNNKVDIVDDVTFTDSTIIAKAKDGEDAYITASIGYKAVLNERGNITDIIVDRIRLAFAGRDVETATHANIEDYDWFFGYEDECVKETYKVLIDALISTDDVPVVYETLVVDTYGDDCDLVKVIDIRIQTLDVVNGKNVYGNFVVPVVDNAKWEGFRFVIEDTVGEWDGVYGDFSDSLVVGICDGDSTVGVVEVDTYLDLAPVTFPGAHGIVVLP